MTNKEQNIIDEKLFKLGERTGGRFSGTEIRKPSSICTDVKTYIRHIKKHTPDDRRDAPSAPERWLKDNWYIAENAAQDAVSFFERAPRLRKSGDDFDVAAAASDMVGYTEGNITKKALVSFILGLQKGWQMSETELYAFVPAVTVALLKKLAEECSDTSEKRETVFRNIFTSLRFIDNFDGSDMIEQVNRVELILRKDPAGVYPKMDKRTRHLYRVQLSKIAEKAGMGEVEAANTILKLAQESREHVGKYIFEMPLGKESKKKDGGGYISALILASIGLSVLLGIWTNSALTAVFALLPASEIVKSITDAVILKTHSPSYIPRLELAEGIPDSAKTVCTLSSVLLSRESVYANIKSLENMSITNRDSGKNLLFAVLADLPESDSGINDADIRLMGCAAEKIKKLNKTDDRFYFFVRRRSFNKSSGKNMGRERKRGAILNFVKYLSGENSEIICLAGNEEKVRGASYIIALDSDTKIYAGEARELVGAALHPLNTPVVDRAAGCVVKGAGIIQPKISVGLDSSSKTYFTRLFAGLGGADPYGSLAGDIYQDLCGYGSFNGKGLINVPVYKMCLSDAFPENTVLSHDILEGAYLKTKYAGDIDFSDGFPARVLSYYSRMHRWVRGDWQNAPWLKKYIEDGKKIRRKNPLSDIDKWKIFDNIRRSLVPPMVFLSIILGAVFPARYFTLSLTALLCLFWEMIFSSVHQLIVRPEEGKTKYHSQIIFGLKAVIAQTISKFILLPYEAYICASAAATAVYRMKVSRKNMLSWVTSAESERKNGGGILMYCKKMWICPVSGIAAVVLSGNVFGTFLFALWLFSPAFACMLCQRADEMESLTFDQRKYIGKQASLIWGYFRDTLTEENNFLPPDNVQIDPPTGAARRTSPTNIGLSLLSCLAAEDMGLVREGEGLSLAEKTVDTVISMKKWHGHLYNWYSTENLKVMAPEYISTVDSGNLLGCLIALKEELRKRKLWDFFKKVQGLIDEMDFGKLYDKKAKLFYIGWDLSENKPTENHYDLMESEARQTSYIATARGTVTREHWRRLSRMLSSDGRYRGMVSWTGTAFEYLMPDLLLPETKNSLSYETGRFCLYAQKKRGGISRPWGTSESCMYEFDAAMSYKYGPHGVQSLALKRDMNSEYVVSPYSSFLALMVEPKEAVKNLIELEKTGCIGKYGFYEAVDYTGKRCGEDKYKVVKTFMAHHLGMSLISIDNVLCSNAMKRRFISDREMGAYAELTAERLPIGETTVKNRVKDVPDRQRRFNKGENIMEVEKISYNRPYAFPLSNGSYTTVVSETGQTKSVWNGALVARCAESELEDGGIDFKVKIGENVYGLHPVSGESCDGYSVKYNGRSVAEIFENEDIRISLETRIFENHIGEKKTLKILNKTDSGREGEIRFYLEPVLQSLRDFQAHPGFSKLQLEYLKKGDSVIARRRGDDGKPVMEMCFICDMDTKYSTSRLKTFGRGNPYYTVSGEVSESFVSAAQEGCITGTTFIDLEPGKEVEVCYAISAGTDDENVYSDAVEILNCQDGGISFFSDSENENALLKDCVKLLTGVFYGKNRRANYKFNPDSKTPKSELWQYGISGDIELLIYSYKGDAAELFRILSAKKTLQKMGILFDLAVLGCDGDGREAVGDYIRRARLEDSLGKPGGVYSIPAEQAEKALDLASSVIDGEIFSDKRELSPKPVFKYRTAVTETKLPVYGYTDKNEFTFTVSGRLPEAVWSNVIANERFGTIAADNGCGFMWNINAHENKINSWFNDRFAYMPTEKIMVNIGGKMYSVFADEDGIECKVTFGYGYARWEKNIEGAYIATTVFAPLEKEAKIISIRGERVPQDAELLYYSDLIMADRKPDARYVVTGFEDGTIRAYNRTNDRFSAFPFSFMSSGELCGFTTSKNSLTEGKFDGFVGTGDSPCIGAKVKFSGMQIFSMGCDTPEALREYLSAEHSEKAFEETRKWWSERVGKIKVRTGNEKIDRYINGWAMYQTIACRLYGRTSVYQNGGAFGFRDQLQDAVCALHTDPNILAQQILRCCSHQFVEGDVQHWWHPGAGNNEGTDPGVRTMCSDDYLWLAWAVCRYFGATGDRTLLDTNVYYIESEKPDFENPVKYEVPAKSYAKESVFDHAVKCLNMLVTRGFGEHGLCKILGGDWNDGMDLVGNRGLGESVWLTFFASSVFGMMADTAKKLDMKIFSENCRFTAGALRENAEKAYNGGWYLRGYWDSGEKLGAPGSGECEIDSISQSSAQFASANAYKTKSALFNAYNKLTDEENGISALFAPPFDGGKTKPGYIKRYAPGVRENGGQYTHAALWLSKALFETGEPDYGYKVLNFILPEDISRYKAEPFVVAADVYTNKCNFGRGGWSWYTGSAGWFYKVAVENMLGLKIRGGRLYIEPNLPKSLDGYSAEIDIDGRKLDIKVSSDKRKTGIQVNGEDYCADGYGLYEKENYSLKKEKI